jgi:Xaa-Pro dipeptidase
MTFNKTRLEKLQKKLSENKIDLAYISNFKTIQYLIGFGSDPFERTLALVLFADSEPFLFTPALEVEVAKSTGWPYKLIGYQDNQDSMKMIIDEIKSRNVSTNKFAIEQSHLTYDKATHLKENFEGSDFSFNLTPIIEYQKLIKEDDEIDKLIQAGKDADLAFEAGTHALMLGKSELQIAAELEYATKMRNVTEMSFATLIQTGSHAADPHGETSDRLLENNSLVLFDLGTVYEGYISDMSRTVALGKPTQHMKDIHAIVLEAQLAAQEAARPGITAAQLDNVARSVIEKAGYGEYFIHRLGHGVGMSEHEFPSIMEGNDLVLQPNMAFSIEPGIYIPNDLGVRIEDSVYITENGAIPFTNSSKELLIF